MESTLSTGLEQALIALTYTTLILLVFISAFVVKLLIDCSCLIKSLQDLSSVLNHELEPTIKELKRALDNINAMAETADKQVIAMKSAVNNFANSATEAARKARGFSLTFLEGIFAGLKLFMRVKRK